MKKWFFIIFSVLAVMAFAAASAGQEERSEKPSLTASVKNPPTVSAFHLPSGLEKIQEEAFEGTAIEIIELPNSLEIIGERAFANIPDLHIIQIPSMTTAIAATAFDGSRHVMIHAAANSNARKFAQENGLPFAPMTVIAAGPGGNAVVLCLENRPGQIAEPDRTEKNEDTNCRRRAEEEQTTVKLEIFCNQIQGRAPPAGECERKQTLV